MPETPEELEVLAVVLRSQQFDAFTLAGLGCGAVLIVAMAASDRAALIGNYGVVRCCPATPLLAPAQMHQSCTFALASVVTY